MLLTRVNRQVSSVWSGQDSSLYMYHLNHKQFSKGQREPVTVGLHFVYCAAIILCMRGVKVTGGSVRVVREL